CSRGPDRAVKIVRFHQKWIVACEFLRRFNMNEGLRIVRLLRNGCSLLRKGNGSYCEHQAQGNTHDACLRHISRFLSLLVTAVGIVPLFDPPDVGSFPYCFGARRAISSGDRSSMCVLIVQRCPKGSSKLPERSAKSWLWMGR